MFSLIITIVSIALVAALALATLYYGGASFQRGATSAQAAAILLQSQQITGAAQTFRADHSRWPDSLAELVNLDYLKAIPSISADSGALSVANAATYEWYTVQDGAPIYAVSGVSQDVCVHANVRSGKPDGVFTKVARDQQVQCWSPGPSGFSVFLNLAPERLGEILGDDRVVDTLPSASSDAGWRVPPRAEAAPEEVPAPSSAVGVWSKHPTVYLPFEDSRLDWDSGFNASYGGARVSTILYMQNQGPSGALGATFSLSGDVSEFEISVPQKQTTEGAAAACEGTLSRGAVTSACTADEFGGDYPVLSLWLTYKPVSFGHHTVTLTSTSTNGSTVAAPLVISRSNFPLSTAVGQWLPTLNIGDTYANNTVTFGATNVGYSKRIDARIRNVSAADALGARFELTGDTDQFALTNGIWKTNTMVTDFGWCGEALPTYTWNCLADNVQDLNALADILTYVEFRPTRSGNHSVTLTPRAFNGASLPPLVINGFAP